jgi:hypothetical protein
MDVGHVQETRMRATALHAFARLPEKLTKSVEMSASPAINRKRAAKRHPPGWES